MPAEAGRLLALCVLLALIIGGAFLMSVFVTGFLSSVWDDKQSPRLFRIVYPRGGSGPKTFLLRALLWAGVLLFFVSFVKFGSSLAGSLWRTLN